MIYLFLAGIIVLLLAGLPEFGILLTILLLLVLLLVLGLMIGLLQVVKLLNRD